MRRLKEPHRHSRRSLIRSTVIDALEGRRLLAAPAISAAASVVVPVGKTLQVPLAGSDADGQALSYAVGSAKGVTASFRSTTNSWLELNTSKGAMNFQLFDDLAPNTVRKIRGLVQSGFYDGLNFHQLVVDASSGYRFAIGGDPKGDGTGGPDFRFDDEFHKDAVFSGTGQLAMVNGQIKDNNGSQFFVTDAPARRYDFNYTIFGQLVRGDASLDSILASPTDSNQKPKTPIIINSARIVENKTDAVLQLRGGSATTSTTITVSATDPDGNRSYKTINVTVNNDGTNANTPPILAPLPPVIVAVPGERFTLPLQAIDLENNTWEIGGTILSGGEGLAYKLQDTSNQRFVFEVKEGYTGAIQIRVGVRETGAVSRGNIDWMPSDVSQALRIYDTQVITIAAGDRPISAEPLTIASYPNIQLREKLLVQFSSQDLDLNKSDFDAVIDWGDGEVVEDADIDEIDDGLFGVYGTHTFARSGNMPLSVRIESRNGFVKTVDSTIYINDPFALIGSTLTVRGTDEDDEVELKVEGATLRAQIGSYSRVYDRAAISLLDIQLFDGDDLLDSGTDVGMPNQRIDAGAGNDTIYAGSGHDYVVAGSGHDIVNGNGGNDTLIGGSGNDSLLSGSGKNFCYGDDGNDRITGSGGRDYFEGGADSDRLYGRGGDDYLDGGGGTDRLYGEDGNDTLIGGSSNDRIYGGLGDDVFWGKQGVDYLTGGGGNDRRGDNDPTDVLFDF